MALIDLVAETALKKMKKHMVEDGITAYIATIDQSGELKTAPVKGEVVIIPKSEYDEMKKILSKKFTNGN